MSSIFQGSRTDGLWWFRVCGRGLHWKDTRKHPLIFSQRYGKQKAIIIGRWRLQYLTHPSQKGSR